MKTRKRVAPVIVLAVLAALVAVWLGSTGPVWAESPISPLPSPTVTPTPSPTPRPLPAGPYSFAYSPYADERPPQLVDGQFGVMQNEFGLLISHVDATGADATELLAHALPDDLIIIDVDQNVKCSSTYRVTHVPESVFLGPGLQGASHIKVLPIITAGPPCEYDDWAVCQITLHPPADTSVSPTPAPTADALPTEQPQLPVTGASAPSVPAKQECPESWQEIEPWMGKYVLRTNGTKYCIGSRVD